MKIHNTLFIIISVILFFVYPSSAMEQQFPSETFMQGQEFSDTKDLLPTSTSPRKRQSTLERPRLEISEIKFPDYIKQASKRPIVNNENKKESPEGLALSSLNVDDFELETPGILCTPIPSFASNEETARPVKSKWKFKRVKKESGFERRKACYRKHFFNEFSPYDAMDIFEKKAQWSKKFNNVGVSKNEIYNKFREDYYFFDEYKHLRNLAKTTSKKHFKKIINHNLNFLEQRLSWEQIYNSHAIMNSDNQIDSEKTLYKISSMPLYMSIQSDYLTFLEELILPIAQNAVEEISWFYHEMSQSALKCPDLSLDQAHALAATNFILRIVGPILYDARSILIKYKGGELQEMEGKELLFQKITLPPPDSKEEMIFIDHMCKRMNPEKIEKIEKTYQQYGRNSSIRKQKERDLTKLIQKSFKSDSQFLESDFHDFLGGFYLLLADELKFLDDPSFGKTQKEIKNIIKLREKFVAFKKNLQAALY